MSKGVEVLSDAQSEWQDVRPQRLACDQLPRLRAQRPLTQPPVLSPSSSSLCLCFSFLCLSSVSPFSTLSVSLSFLLYLLFHMNLK